MFWGGLFFVKVLVMPEFMKQMTERAERGSLIAPRNGRNVSVVRANIGRRWMFFQNGIV